MAVSVQQQGAYVLFRHTYLLSQAEEFELKGQEMEAQIKAGVHLASSKRSKAITEIMCEHKDTGTPHFSHGLCRPCYEEVCCRHNAVCFCLQYGLGPSW